LHAPYDLRLRRCFLPEVSPDDGIKLGERLKYGEIHLRKKVAGKYHPAIAIYHERFQ
jgi:hypothetical protein